MSLYTVVWTFHGVEAQDEVDAEMRVRDEIEINGLTHITELADLEVDTLYEGDETDSE